MHIVPPFLRTRPFGVPRGRRRAAVRPLAVAIISLAVACAEEAPLTPGSGPEPEAAYAAVSDAQIRAAVAKLRRATDRYHDLNAALADGFVHLHACEVRDDGPVGTVYVHPGRLSDAIIDPSLPEAIIYAPGRNGRLNLVGVELVVPYSLWPGQTPPAFLGHTFQPEDEFGVFGLHVWVWRTNPSGLFAETNPRIDCGLN